MQPRNSKSIASIELEQAAVDPLRIVAEHLDDTGYTETLREDIETIDDVLRQDQSLKGAERQRLYGLGLDLRLDWLYSEEGGRKLGFDEFSAEWESAHKFATKAASYAEKHDAVNPIAVWSTATQLLDLRALRVHRLAQEARTNLKDTKAGEHAWGEAHTELKDIVLDSTKLMSHLEQFLHYGSKPEDGVNPYLLKASGTLFETMLTTYARLDSYRQGTFDDVFIRSALHREDRHRATRSGELHRVFDIVMQGVSGVNLLQTESHARQRRPKMARISRDGEKYEVHYEPRITNVTIEHFAKVRDNPAPYIGYFKSVANHVPGTPETPHFKGAERKLAETFGAQLVTAKSGIK